MRRQLRDIIRILLPAVAAFVWAASPGSAQVIEAWRLGGFVSWGGLDYAADLRGLPGVPSCCPHYEDGDGSAFAAGGLWGLPLFPRVAWEGRISFAIHNGTLSAEEYELVTAGRDTVTATFGHTVRVSQPALGLDALFSVETLPRLKLIGGARGEFMMGGTFHQEETILSPGNIRFENDRRQRLVYDAEIPDETPLHFSLLGGIRYEVLLNRQGSMVLAPEILFWQDFTDVVENQSWRERGFRIGLALQYIHEKAPDTPSPLDPLPIIEREPMPSGAEPSDPDENPPVQEEKPSVPEEKPPMPGRGSGGPRGAD